MVKYEIKPNDQFIASIKLKFGSSLRGILKDPDLVSDDYFEKIVQTIEKIGNAPIYAHFPVSQNVRQIYLDALNAVIQKMYHSSAVRRAYPEGEALANGLSLDAQYQVSQTRQLNGNQEVEKLHRDLQESYSAEFQTYLIGGIKNKRKFGRNLQQEAASVKVDDGNIYKDWARRIDYQLNHFIEKFIPTLNPGNKKFTYQTKSFDIAAYAQYAGEYKDQTMFIREKDLYWQLPDSVFDSSQGQASDKHEVSLKALKYTANPFIFEEQPGGFVESNVTDLTFYDSQMNHINVTLVNSYIMIKEPYKKSQAYEDELMRCMTWNTEQNKFINDNSCSVSKIFENIPCYSCDEDVPLNVSITVCRCTHIIYQNFSLLFLIATIYMSRFAVVFQQTVPQTGKGVQVGIYSDFFAMQYWRNSFGLYAVIAGAVSFAVGQIFMVLADRYLQPKVMTKLKERIRRLELKGFQQKPKQKRLIVKRDFDGNIIFIRNKVEGEDIKGKNPQDKAGKQALLEGEQESKWEDVDF